MSDIKVLVLCQRKSGKDHTKGFNGYDVKDSTVPLIHLMLDHFFPGKEHSVEYMSAMQIGERLEDSVDYAFNLREESPDAIEFVKTHPNYYSLVLLNTCPFVTMNYKMIEEIMKDDGRMVFSVFPAEGTRFNEGVISNIISYLEDVSMDYPQNLSNYFVRTDETGPEGLSPIFVFKKKMHGGTTYKKRRKISLRFKKKQNKSTKKVSSGKKKTYTRTKRRRTKLL